MAEYTAGSGRGYGPSTQPGAGRAPLQGDGLSDRSIGSIVSEIFEQAQRLIRAEVELAKAELRAEVNKVQDAGKMLGVGAVLLLLGGMAFTALLFIVLNLFMPLWLSALIVTVLYLAVGGVLANNGLKKLKQVHPPEKTLQTLKEDGQWATRTFQSMKSEMRGHA
jgi:uncharacterized membrane protein YqjE